MRDVHCPACGNTMKRNLQVRRLYRCSNPICAEFDRWKTVRIQNKGMTNEDVRIQHSH